MYELAAKNQYDVNAKDPTFVDTVDESLINMKFGRRYDNETGLSSIGYVRKGLVTIRDMGQISENAKDIGQTLPLAFFQVREDDAIHLNFGNAQSPGVLIITVSLRGVNYKLSWDGAELSYYEVIAGAYSTLSHFIGATLHMQLTDGT